jgi:hypothetical protein
MMPPGSRLLGFASLWFDPAIVHRTFEPLIADWQREWQDSTPSRRVWVWIRGFSAFCCAAAISTPSIILAPTPPEIARRVLLRVSVFCTLVAALLSVPILRSMAARSMESLGTTTLLLLALPSALAVAFPFAMVIAVDAIRTAASTPSRIERAAALKLALIGVCVMLVLPGVIAPAANAEWRERSTPPGWNVPEAELRRLSTLDLLTHPDRHSPIVPQHYTRAGEIRRELNNRAVLAIIPVLFIWLRWGTLNHMRRGRWWPLPALLMTALVAVAFFALDLAGIQLEFRLAWQPGTGLWVPVIAFVLVGVVAHSRGRFAWQ